MSESKVETREQSFQSEGKSNFLGGEGSMQFVAPPSFNLTAGPLQRQVVAQRQAIDYTPYVAKIVPIFQEIHKYKDHPFVSEEFKAVKGGNLQDVFKEVQGAGGITSEFLAAVKVSLGGDAVFQSLHQTLNDMGLTWALEGATGIRVKNLTEGDLQAAGGGQSFSIRSSASAKDSSNILGELNHSMEDLGPMVSVTYDEETKTEFMGIRIRKEGLTGLKLNAGKKLADLPDVVWIGMGGLRVTAKWEVFLEQLSNFDTMTMGMSLNEKLTKLRQFGQRKDMGERMDSELGTKARPFGPQYEDDRQSFDNVFQMLKEVDQVETPLGIVDMHHFLIALESYQKKNKDVVFDPWWVDFGKAQDACSFAGNIGAAAAEYVHKNSTNYENSIGKGASEEDKMRFYYKTRTTEAELLGELDGWGALPSLESGKVTTLTDLIKSYYGGTTAPVTGGTKEHPRKGAMQRFMSNYGLTSAGGTLNNPANVAIIDAANVKFAKAWWYAKSSTFGEKTKETDVEAPSKKMTEWFLEFLTNKAKEYKVF
jgi:hypothetical protein